MAVILSFAVIMVSLVLFNTVFKKYSLSKDEYTTVCVKVRGQFLELVLCFYSVGPGD